MSKNHFHRFLTSTAVLLFFALVSATIAQSHDDHATHNDDTAMGNPSASGTGASGQSTPPTDFKIPRGSFIQIPLESYAKNSSSSTMSWSVQKEPEQGIVQLSDDMSTLSYRHGGTSLKQDSFTLQNDSNALKKVTLDISVSFFDPSSRIAITYPAEGEIVNGGRLVVEYTIEGVGHDHLHLSLNAAPHITIDQLDGQYVFYNLPAGTHTLEASLADSQHRDMRHSGAQFSVSFTVR